MNSLEALVGQDLAGFKIVMMTEVTGIDDQGRTIDRVGFLVNPDVIRVFRSIQTACSGYHTSPTPVLTNGIVAFALDCNKTVDICPDEIQALRDRRANPRFSTGEDAALGHRLVSS
jgi:hypothetical protein